MRHALFVAGLLLAEFWPVLVAMAAAVLLVWWLPWWALLAMLGCSGAVLGFGYLLRRHRDGWQDGDG